MLEYCEKEISKEIYEASLEKKRSIPSDLMGEVFSQATLCGYGVYSTYTFEKDGKYYVRYSTSTSCD